MSTYNLLLCLPKYHNKSMRYKCLNKSTLSPTGMSTVEKFKCIKQDLLNLALFIDIKLID